MDFQALLYSPAHLLLGVDAQLVVADTMYVVRAIDKTTGIDTGVSVRGQSILPVAILRVKELKALGLAVTSLGSASTFICLNGSWWSVVTYRMRPTPNGEGDGEVLLVLDKNGAPSQAASTNANRALDFQSLLFEQGQKVFGTNVLLLLAGAEFNISGIDKTSGVDVGEAVKGQTILPACVLRAQEYLALGLQYSALGHRTSFIKLNNVWWRIVTYRMRPGPYGEDDGEIYILLAKIPVVEPVLLPPGIFLDESALDVPYITTDLGVTIGSPILDDAVLSVIMTFDFHADFADELGLIPVPIIGTGLIATITDEGTFAASAPEIGIRLSAVITDDSAFAIAITDDMRAAMADDTGLASTIIITSTLSAAIVDDTGLSSTLLVTTLLVANPMVDLATLDATLTVAAIVDLSASLADDTGLSGIIGTDLVAMLADDTGLTPTLSAAWLDLPTVIRDDLGLASSLLVTTSLTAPIADDLGLASTMTVTAGLTKTFRGTNIQSTAGSSQTWNSAPIGTAATDRFLIIVPIVGDPNNNLTVTGVTVNGTAATAATSPNGDRLSLGFYYIKITAGTTATIVASWSGTATGNSSIIALWTVTGNPSLAPVASANNPVSLGNVSATNSATRTLATGSPGVSFACGVGFSGAIATAAATWTGITSVDATVRTSQATASHDFMADFVSGFEGGANLSLHFTLPYSSSNGSVYGNGVSFV